ncbi:MAG: hypothetical protein OXU79_21240 [Gemmatimonadota bacterium]|nr:hypothetical protein [Gemmatimonadota bacterium]
MMRAISIFLIVAIALQTVGCSTWKPLARAGEVTEEDRQASMRDEVQGKLREGMAVRIRIREGTSVPIKDRVLECIVEEVGITSLTLIPITDHVRGTVKREFTLHFSDIVRIEYRQFERGLTTLIVGLTAGATLALVLFAIACARAFSE